MKLILPRGLVFGVLLGSVVSPIPLFGQRGCYNSEAEKSAELRETRRLIQQAEAKNRDDYISMGMGSYLDRGLQILRAGESLIQKTPICGTGGTAANSGFRPYRGGLPPEEMARASAEISAEIAEFARRDAQRANNEIEANRQFYSRQRDQIARDFAGVKDTVMRNLRAAESSQGGEGARDRGRTRESATEAARQRADYNQQRQDLINRLVDLGMGETDASSAATDALAPLLQGSGRDAAIDAAIADPNSFSPGSALRDYPAAGSPPLYPGPVEVPQGALPPADPLDKLDPLLRPNGGTLDDLYEYKEAQAKGTAAVPPGGAETMAATGRGADIAATETAQQEAGYSNAAGPTKDSNQPGYAEAVAEMRQQDAAYSAKVRAEIADPNSRAGQFMQGDLSGVGEDMRLQQQSGSSARQDPPTTSSAAGDSKVAPLDSIPPAGESAPNLVLARDSTQAGRTSATAPVLSAAVAPLSAVTNNAQPQTALPPAADNGATRGMSLDEALRTEGPLRSSYEPSYGSVSNTAASVSGNVPSANNSTPALRTSGAPPLTASSVSVASATTSQPPSGIPPNGAAVLPSNGVSISDALANNVTYERTNLNQPPSAQATGSSSPTSFLQPVGATKLSLKAGPLKVTPGDDVFGPVKGGSMTAKFPTSGAVQSSIGASFSENNLSIPITVGPKMKILNVVDAEAGLEVAPSVSAQHYHGDSRILSGSLKSFDFQLQVALKATLSWFGTGFSVSKPMGTTLKANSGPLNNPYYMDSNLKHAFDELDKDNALFDPHP